MRTGISTWMTCGQDSSVVRAPFAAKMQKDECFKYRAAAVESKCVVWVDMTLRMKVAVSLHLPDVNAIRAIHSDSHWRLEWLLPTSDCDACSQNGAHCLKRAQSQPCASECKHLPTSECKHLPGGDVNALVSQSTMIQLQ
jgi:hypothetical protein